MSGPREGYPRINDPNHPLWAEQQDGWPDYLPHEAWAALAQLVEKRRASSAEHPAFGAAYIVNKEASRPDAAAPATVEAPPKERR